MEGSSAPKRTRAGGDHAAAMPRAHEPPVRERATRPPAAGPSLRPSQVPGLRETTSLAGASSPRPEQVRQLRPSGASAGAAFRPARPSTVPARSVQDVLRGSGQPLTAPLKEEMQARLGTDLSDVRIHTGSAARASATEVGARAYTSGSHVVIGDGGADKHTLAHELTHIIQQRQGPVAGTSYGAFTVSDPADRDEKAAEANATAVMRAPLSQHRLAGRPAGHLLEEPGKAQPAIQRALFIAGTKVSPDEVMDKAFEVAGSSASVIGALESLARDDEVIAKFGSWKEAVGRYSHVEYEAPDEAEPEIPQLIHFIWIGRPPSRGAVDNIFQWAVRASNTGWRIILWTDAELEKGDWTETRSRLAGTVDIRPIEPMLDPQLRNFYHIATKGPSPAFNMASDLARYSILVELGGVYADVDVGPGKVDLSKVPRMGLGDVPILAPQVRDRRALKEQLSEDELKALAFAAQVHLAATKAYLANQLNNNLIITQPRSTFLYNLISNVRQAVEKDLKSGGSNWAENAALITGPQAVIRTMFAQLNLPDRLMDFFDPDSLANWSELEWLTAESESQSYGEGPSPSTSARTATGLLASISKFFQ